MINRSSGGVIRNVEMINAPTYGMPTYWCSWGLTYSPNGYTKNTMVYHTYHASKPEMAATQRDIDIVGDNPKSLIPKERWLLTNP